MVGEWSSALLGKYPLLMNNLQEFLGGCLLPFSPDLDNG